ncbi:serine/threonine protein kinase [Streptomyces dioscori]|uniref:non-specific serine/threonine protein kinase n=1 Tax=Streptomyces dioscori TaxID=2109333 RepID=A0A2P8QG10_9ACTN|nr:serine/threonine-protein kinase [Streptomyces dioscori]PSM45189.1 serine/threonine protein kinase [Streptomyces dioscori]
MGNAGAAANELVAGRYRLQEVVHHEVGCVCWYGEDIEYARPRLLTQTQLPPDPGEDRAGPAVARIRHASEVMGLRCPGAVASVIDVVEEYGSLWTVVEWIDGMPLGEFLDQHGPLDHAAAARIGLDVLGVLEAAHGAGLVHGELSLGQVFVRDHGGVVVSGYGLAGAGPGARIGAPAYASPEQARGEAYGSPADLWALGALLHTMTEGRPPFRDRGQPEATLKAIVRLPLRSPRHAGPLARTMQGLLRKDSRERLTGPVVRDALVRIVNDDPAAAEGSLPQSRASAHGVLGLARGRKNLGRAALIGTAVAAVVAVTMTALAATGDGSGDDVSATDATASRPGPVLPTGDEDGAGTPSSGTASPTTSPSPSASSPPSPSSSPPSPSSSSSSSSSSSGKLPAGFRVFTASEGFAVALPKGWQRLSTNRAEDDSYRVVFGADGDPRELAVTYSTRVGSDPVAVWRDTVEPSLRKESGYDRLGAIRATTYQGREAADMEWVDESEGTRVRTFGRGFLIGGGEGFSIRWAAPADDWEDAANQQALKAFLTTFRGLPA